MKTKEILTPIFFIIVIVALILNVFIAGGIFGLLLGLTQLGFSIAGLVLSIMLVKRRKLGLGITFLILFSLFLLLFVAGVYMGVTNQIQSPETSLVGQVIANII